MPDIDAAISRSLGRPFKSRSQNAASGGCINSAVVVDSGTEKFFVKLNSPSRISMFEAEAAGLAEIAQAGALRVPAPVCAAADADRSFLVLEYLKLSRATTSSARLLGDRLAEMHAVPRGYFGWHRDNTIGTTPQPNPKSPGWVKFFRLWRLEHQLTLARTCGPDGAGLQAKGQRLCQRLGEFFPGYEPFPSLLHGDLWGGNFAALGTGEPVVFDPAAYYGDREADLAMTELFGGFPDEFYQAYAARLPLDDGYPVRRQLYNLYHLLNHYNLFGASYARQADDAMDALLAELG